MSGSVLEFPNYTTPEILSSELGSGDLCGNALGHTGRFSQKPPSSLKLRNDCVTPAQRLQQRSQLPPTDSRQFGCRPLSTDEVGERMLSRYSSLRARPKSAFASSEGRKNPAFNPYQTSYKYDYYSKPAVEESNGRPQSHIALDSEALRDETTYGMEYDGKQTTLNAKLWSGGNNPHPSTAFMVWKYPTRDLRRPHTVGPESSERILTNDVYDKAIRGKTHSTYQGDYKGLPPGYMPSELKESLIKNDWKSNLPYTLDSAARMSYQVPNQPEQLSNNTARFGNSGHDRHKLLVGITPNASQRKAALVSSTTYDRHFNKVAPRVDSAAKTHFPNHARTVVRGKGEAELAAMYDEIKRKHSRQGPPSRTITPSHSLPGGYSLDPAVAKFLNRNNGVPSRSIINHIPHAEFITTPVPEPICEPCY